MSQQPPGFPPYNPSMPPPGDFGGNYGFPAPSRLSAASVTSLVCGLIFCIPFVTGLVAIVTGAVGISVTSNPSVRGRGMAIAGLILGIIGLGLWGLLGLGTYNVFRGSTPSRLFAQTYIADLAAGRIDRCEQNSSSNVTQQNLQDDYSQLKSWGTVQNSMVFPIARTEHGGAVTFDMMGACMFSGKQHRFQMTVTDASGTLKVDSFQWLQ
jgi:hypothetical protein